MADGIEVEQMVESRPKKVNIFSSLATAEHYPAEFLLHVVASIWACGLLADAILVGRDSQAMHIPDFDASLDFFRRR